MASLIILLLLIAALAGGTYRLWRRIEPNEAPAIATNLPYPPSVMPPIPYRPEIVEEPDGEGGPAEPQPAG
jgi:hypothetical protein